MLALDAIFFRCQKFELSITLPLYSKKRKKKQNWLTITIGWLFCVAFWALVHFKNFCRKSYRVQHKIRLLHYVHMAFKECKTCTFQRTRESKKAEWLLLNPLLSFIHFSIFRCWFDFKLRRQRRSSTAVDDQKKPQRTKRTHLWNMNIHAHMIDLIENCQQKAIVNLDSVCVSAACAEHNAPCQYDAKLILAAFIVWSTLCYYFISFSLWFSLGSVSCACCSV